MQVAGRGWQVWELSTALNLCSGMQTGFTVPKPDAEAGTSETRPRGSPLNNPLWAPLQMLPYFLFLFSLLLSLDFLFLTIFVFIYFFHVLTWLAILSLSLHHYVLSLTFYTHTYPYPFSLKHSFIRSFTPYPFHYPAATAFLLGCEEEPKEQWTTAI